MAKSNKSTFTAILDRFPGKGGLHFAMVPDRVAKQYTTTTAVRMKAVINDVLEFHCAIRPKGGGAFYINVGTPIRTKLKLKAGDKLSFVVWPDKSEYGRKMPTELKELMDQDAEASKLFHEQKPSLQRGIIYYVDGAKSLDKRIERALMMINRLKYNPEAFNHKKK